MTLKRSQTIFFLSAPVAFRRVALETPEWTSRDSNHHRQSVSAGKTNAIPTEPSGRLSQTSQTTSKKVLKLPKTFFHLLQTKRLQLKLQKTPKPTKTNENPSPSSSMHKLVPFGFKLAVQCPSGLHQTISTFSTCCT